MPIVPYSPRDHGAWVYTAFSLGSGEPRETLDRVFDAGATCAVLTGVNDPNLLVSFAIVMPGKQTVAWVYTRQRAGELLARKNGFAKVLLEHLGIDVKEPIIPLFWSPMIAQLRRRGYRIMPPIKERGGEVRT